jgi:UDP-N-acetylglucosamine:LPS N-acetylglucosamine transferase
VKQVVERDLGRFVPRPDDLVDAVTAWFAKPESQRLDDAARARAAADPAAAFQIADVMVKLSA